MSDRAPLPRRPSVLRAVGRWIPVVGVALLLAHPSPGGPGLDPSSHLVPAPLDPPESWATLVEEGPCLGEVPCLDARSVFVDYAALDVPGQVGGEWITYDYEEVTRPLTVAEMADESELSLAVRLVVSEIGADRLLVNRYGLLEAVGILYTVDNRLDRATTNPLAEPLAPDFPGCGAGGTFYACANAQQYLGMATWRALTPSWRYADDLLEGATDLAVVAWWLQESGSVPDFTEGATNYVHRCGAAGYGLTTPHCDGHLGRPRGDVRGANPFTGPIVFKAPEEYLRRKGFYSLYESRWVDYVPWDDLDFLPPSDLVADADSDEVLGEGLSSWVPHGFNLPDEGVRAALRRVYDPAI